MTRGANIRLLFGAVRRLAGGEEILRAKVALINERDQTNSDVVGKPEYSSTKRLSDAQLAEVADALRRAANLPPPSRELAGPKGGRSRRPESAAHQVAYFSTAGERAYLFELFRLLEWAEDKRDAFITRQTKGKGIGTHKAVNAVIAPLERMARARGFIIVEKDRIKTIQAPPAKASESAS